MKNSRPVTITLRAKDLKFIATTLALYSSEYANKNEREAADAGSAALSRGDNAELQRLTRSRMSWRRARAKSHTLSNAFRTAALIVHYGDENDAIDLR